MIQVKNLSYRSSPLMLPQPFLCFFIVRAVLLDEGSELRTMIEMDEMSEFMDDDIVQDEERELGEFPVEDKISLWRTTSSSTTSSRDLDRLIGEMHDRCVMFDSLGDESECFFSDCSGKRFFSDFGLLRIYTFEYLSHSFSDKGEHNDDQRDKLPCNVFVSYVE